MAATEIGAVALLSHEREIKFYMFDAAPLESCQAKQNKLIALFAGCATPQQKYEKIIEFGRQLPPYPPELKTPDRLVKGCQSEMYLHSAMHEGKIQFQTFSEALISSGLAALLLFVYHDEPPAAILTCPPRFLDELGIHESLSPGRSNGLSSLFLRMKKEALNFLVATQS
jgi:cysteine desulfuration protein SufE